MWSLVYYGMGHSTDYGCEMNCRIPLAGSGFAMAIETVFKAVNLFHRIESSSATACNEVAPPPASFTN